MRKTELLRLVWINITQNKFKAIMTSIGIIVGAATIVMVIAIGKGGQKDVAAQFKNLNAGAIDISYQGDGANSNSKTSSSSSGSSSGSAMMPGGGSGSSGGGGMPSGGGGMPSGSSSGGGMPSGDSSGGGPGGGFGGFFGGNSDSSRVNQKKVTLTSTDVDDIETFVSGISSATISFSTKSTVDGGDLEEEETDTIAGVKSNYATISNLTMAVGSFISDSDDTGKEKVCVLGSSIAKTIFGSAIDAYGSKIYIDDRAYIVDGVLDSMGTVASGISPDDSIFIPYDTGIKYLAGNNANPTITVIAKDVNKVDTVISDVTNLLADSYANTEFTYTDAGSKMEAANASNKVLTMLLIAMAAIVFLVGGIGIMNVLFVSVKERTNEIGILKAIGCSRKNILFEFLFEASFISLLGGVIGVILSVVITPIVQYFGVTVVLSGLGFVLALGFALLTGTVFGFYPAFKASKLVPVEALNAE